MQTIPMRGWVTTGAVAAALVTVFTLARALLNPLLGILSPFTLYVAAVLVAGLVRGSACGVLVMIGSSLCGYYLFVEPQGGWGVSWPGVIALLIFWLVSGPVLLAAKAMRRYLWDLFDRYVRRLEVEP